MGARAAGYEAGPARPPLTRAPEPLTQPPPHRARDRTLRGSRGACRGLLLPPLAIALWVVAGGFAYFIPAASAALQATGQQVNVPSPTSLLFTPSPSPGQDPSHGTF